MGSGDRSTPAKSPVLRNPRPSGDGKVKDSKPDETGTGKLLASRTVSIGEAPEKAAPPPKASPNPRGQGKPRPRMETLPGGVSIPPTPSRAPAAPPIVTPSPVVTPPVVTPSPLVTRSLPPTPSLKPSAPVTPSLSPSSAAGAPPDSKRKLQPVPLPWQKPAERILKPDPAVLLVGADETFLPAIEKAL